MRRVVGYNYYSTARTIACLDYDIVLNFTFPSFRVELYHVLIGGYRCHTVIAGEL